MANIKKVEKKETGLVIFGDGDDQKKRDFFVTGEAVDNILEQISKEVLEHDPDTSTAKGRSAIKANVTKATTYKTFLESAGKELSKEKKSIPKKIDATRNKIEKFMVNLQKEARQELTDWEDEQKVIAAKKLEKEEAEKWQAQVDADHELAIEQYKNHLREVADKKIVDAMAAEKLLEQKRQEQIAHDKDVAETARIKAEQEAENKIAAVEKEKQDAIDLAAKLKQDAINEKAIAKQAKINADDLLILNDAHRDNDAFDAEKARLYGIEQSRLDEIQRQKDKQARIQKETDNRESDKKHKGKIHRDILKVLKDNGIGEEDGKTMIKLACKRLLPKLTINY